jgi:hypothetical protein
MKSEGTVQVVVRSRKIPVGTILRTEPIYSASGVLVGWKPSRLVLYGRSLGDGNRRTIREAERLACNLGLELKVVDRSTSGLLNRLLSQLGNGGQRYPSIVVSRTPVMTSLSHGC